MTACSRSAANYIARDPLRALTTFAHSESIDLQHMAALTMAANTRHMRGMTRGTLDTILVRCDLLPLPS